MASEEIICTDAARRDSTLRVRLEGLRWLCGDPTSSASYRRSISARRSACVLQIPWPCHARSQSSSRPVSSTAARSRLLLCRENRAGRRQGLSPALLWLFFRLPHPGGAESLFPVPPFA